MRGAHSMMLLLVLVLGVATDALAATPPEEAAARADEACQIADGQLELIEDDIVLPLAESQRKTVFLFVAQQALVHIALRAHEAGDLIGADASQAVIAALRRTEEYLETNFPGEDAATLTARPRTANLSSPPLSTAITFVRKQVDAIRKLLTSRRKESSR